MTRHIPRPFTFFAVLTAAAALMLLILAFGTHAVPLSIHLLLMLVASIIAEAMAVQLPRGGSQSMSYPLSLASIVLFGPAGGALVSAASGISYRDLRDSSSPQLLLFNLSQILVSTIASAYVYVALGGQVLLRAEDSGVIVQSLRSADFPGALVPMFGLALTSFLLNAVLASAATALLRSVSFRRVWAQNISWLAPAQIALAFFGYAVAQVVAVSPFGFVLFIFPLIVSRQVFQGYVSLLSTYLDTVRALVATIEAKDRYTVGHSQRVASYAVALARAMSLGDEQVRTVEYCALLHDLGKVGIASHLLNKPAMLTASEMRVIREHPETGAAIAEKVPFLRDIGEIIRAHHERYDGCGYGRGLSGDSIPREARILAVADTFDAMTSERAYRSACSTDEAIQEIRRNAGTQFDPSVVAVVDVLCASDQPGHQGRAVS